MLPTRPFLLRLAPDLLRAIDTAAARAGKTRTGLIRQRLGQGFPTATAGGEEGVPGAALGSRHQIHIRLPAPDFDRACGRAAGWRSVAAWAAAVVRTELGKPGPLLSDADRLAIAASVRELRRLGVNLNQVAHRLNADPRHTITELERTDLQRALHGIDLHVDFVENLFIGPRLDGGGRRGGGR